MRIAVLDDSREDAQQLIDYLHRFQEEQAYGFKIDVYYSSFDFLEEYHGNYDVIFLDIEMPGSDGIEVAREIRSKDQAVGIIFVTSMAQYAINGYEVNAIDFMVKPVGYYNFTTKLEKAFRFFQNRNERDIVIHSKGNIRRIVVSGILYIEKNRDDLLFHTKEGCFEERGSVKTLKEKLAELPFAECTAGCLVNMEFVKRVGKDSITLSGDIQLPLSRRQKKEFTQEFIHYIGVEE